MRFRRAGLFGCGRDFFQAVNAPRAEQQFRAFRAKRPRRRRAKPAGRAGDEHPFVFQRKFHAIVIPAGRILDVVRLGRKFEHAGNFVEQKSHNQRTHAADDDRDDPVQRAAPFARRRHHWLVASWHLTVAADVSRLKLPPAGRLAVKDNCRPRCRAGRAGSPLPAEAWIANWRHARLVASCTSPWQPT